MGRCVLRSCAPAGCFRRRGARSLSAFSRTSTSAGTRVLATAPPYISLLESHPSGPKTLRSFGPWHGVSRTLCRRSDPGGPLQFAAKAMTQAVLQGIDVKGAQRLLSHGLPVEVIVSNIGRLNFDGRLGDLHLRSAWGMSSMTGWDDEQIVGVLTLWTFAHDLH